MRQEAEERGIQWNEARRLEQDKISGKDNIGNILTSVNLFVLSCTLSCIMFHFSHAPNGN